MQIGEHPQKPLCEEEHCSSGWSAESRGSQEALQWANGQLWPSRPDKVMLLSAKKKRAIKLDKGKEEPWMHGPKWHAMHCESNQMAFWKRQVYRDSAGSVIARAGGTREDEKGEYRGFLGQ